jgi:Rps23 Pro-64 3,4-dihydroxylase Tpa1-like proline 4-hydroxylase
MFNQISTERVNSNTEPFRFHVLQDLFVKDSLKFVESESNNLSFSLKQTDIYKLNQTGDLLSLDKLDKSQLDRLPNILILRNALYSHQFRDFLRRVTGCGPLSGTQQDMSLVSYTPGCHLLNHDDVIGTRRLSYILYLPQTVPWNPDWGGALELYPVNKSLEPEPVPSVSLLPNWNQFVFFEVQPGHSFHSVQEVVHGHRLSISGWFHAPQPGEPDYTTIPKEPSLQSSRNQLTSSSTSLTPYHSPPTTPDPPLTDEHISFLSNYLNPIYLQHQTIQKLAARFADESNIELHSFLAPSLVKTILTSLRNTDDADNLGPARNGLIPPHTAGTTDSQWAIKGPPHKWRYCTLSSGDNNNNIMRTLQDDLFKSEPFRIWIANVSSLIPLAYSVEARRFRPGLDYTLATSEEKEARLDVVLGLTPDHDGWKSGDWGGWEVGFSLSLFCTYSFSTSVTWPLTTRKTILPFIDRVPPRKITKTTKTTTTIALY